MKRIAKMLCLALFIFGISNTISAQIGVRAGANLATWNGAVGSFGGISPQNSPGMDIALVLGGYNEDKASATQMEIGYLQKGVMAQYGGAKVTLHLNYLEMALMPKVNFGGGSSNITLFAGGTMGALMNAYSTEYYNGQRQTQNKYNADELEMNELDFGWVAGGGVNFILGNSIVTLDVRYRQGLSNLDRGGDNSDKIMNKGLGVGLTIQMNR